MAKAPAKRPRGRPPKSGHGYSVVMRIREEFDKAMDLLDDRETPLHEIIARELADNPTKMLQAIGSFMPKNIDVQVSAEGSYLDALKSVQQALEDTQSKVIDRQAVDIDFSEEK